MTEEQQELPQLDNEPPTGETLIAYTVCGPTGAWINTWALPHDRGLPEAIRQCEHRNRNEPGHFIEARRYLGFNDGYEYYPTRIDVYGPPEHPSLRSRCR